MFAILRSELGPAFRAAGAGSGERGEEPLGDDALAVGPAGLLFWGGGRDPSRARRRENEGPDRGPGLPGRWVGLTAPLAFPLISLRLP